MRATVLGLALLILWGLIQGGDSQASELSDAMKAAADDGTPVESKRSRHTDATDEDYSSDDSPIGDAVGSLLFEMLACFHGAHYEDTDYAWQLPVDAGYALSFNGDIRGLARFSTTLLSVEGDQASFGIYFNGGLVQMKSGSLPDRATSGARTFGIGAAFRYYFLRPQQSPWNPYFTTQVGWQGVGWDYRNPVDTTDGDRLYNDGLSACDCYAGCGLTFNRSHWISVYGELGFGGMFLANRTYEGFHNDVFDNFGYFSAKAGLSLKF